MAFVIAEPCISVKDTACVEVCPVDCIYEGEDQLFINPTECIDCGACEPVCPVEAIFPLEKVPGQWGSFIQKNVDFFSLNPDAKPAPRKGEAAETAEKEEEATVVAVEAVATEAEPKAKPVPPVLPVPAVPVVQKPVERPRAAVAVERAAARAESAKKPAQPAVRLKAPVSFIVQASQPLLGALSAKFKRELEAVAQDPKVFSAAVATGANCLLNTVIYLIILTTLGIKNYGLYSNLTNLYIFMGLVLGILETIIRFRKGMVMMVGENSDFPATWYGKPLSFILEPILPVIRKRFLEPVSVKEKPQTVPASIPTTIYSDDLTERDRRYGLVHRMVEKPDRYLITVEFSRRVPYSKRKEELGLPDEMPDYKRQISLQGNLMTLEARLEDPRMLQVVGRASSFPASFLCEFKFDKEVFGYDDEYRNKDLEITVYKKKAIGK